MKIALIGLGQIGSRYDVDLKTSFSHRNSILRNIRDSEKFYIDKDIAYVESIAKKDKFDCFKKLIVSILDNDSGETYNNLVFPFKTSLLTSGGKVFKNSSDISWE